MSDQQQLQADWLTLSDDELRSRLEQRGYTDPIVGVWIDTRDYPETVWAISDILGRD